MMCSPEPSSAARSGRRAHFFVAGLRRLHRRDPTLMVSLRRYGLVAAVLALLAIPPPSALTLRTDEAFEAGVARLAAEAAAATEADLRFEGVTLTAGGARVAFESRDWELVLAPLGRQEQVYARTESFDIYFRGTTSVPEAGEQLVAAIARLDDGGFRTAGEVDGRDPAVTGLLRRLAAWVGLVLLACLLFRLSVFAASPTPPRALGIAVRLCPWLLLPMAAAGALLLPVEVGAETAAGRSFLVAAALIVLPLLAGYGLAELKLLGRPHIPRRGQPLVTALLVLAVAAVTVTATSECRTVGGMDIILIGALALTGLLLARRLAAFVETALLFLVLVEVLQRLFLPLPPRFPPPFEARLFFETELDERACGGIFPDHYPNHGKQLSFAARVSLSSQRETTVLHVGDSVVQGTGVEMNRAFPALLSAMQPRVAHLNAGFEGTGSDFFLLLVREWTARLPVDGVVLYLSGNDSSDMFNEYLCCPGGPLVDYGADGEVVPWCTSPHQSAGLGVRLRHSPLPYAVRVATFWADAAANLLARFGSRARTRSGKDVAAHLACLKALVQWVGALGLPLVIVQHRSLEELRSFWRGENESHRRLSQAMEGLDVTIWDAAEAFEGPPGGGDPRRWFVADEFHLSKEGHRRLADFLAPRLARLHARP